WRGKCACNSPPPSASSSTRASTRPAASNPCCTTQRWRAISKIQKRTRPHPGPPPDRGRGKWNAMLPIFPPPIGGRVGVGGGVTAGKAKTDGAAQEGAEGRWLGDPR